MIKAVIFDMDGVIMDSEHHYLQHLVKFYQSQGIDIVEEDLYFLVGCDLDTQYKKMTQFYDKEISAEDIRLQYETWASTQPDFDVRSWLFEHTHELLKILKDKGYKLAVGSNSGKDHLEMVIKTCDLTPYFMFTDSADIHPAGKPDPTIYKHLMEKMAVEPHECIILEDSYAGILAAKRSGAKVLGIKDYKYNVDQSLADELIDTTMEVLNYL